MKTYGEVLLILALVGGDWLASFPGQFTPGKGARYPVDRRLGEPQDLCGGHPTGGSNSDPSAVQPDCAIPALPFTKKHCTRQRPGHNYEKPVSYSLDSQV
jgi:hypothetical protein